MSNKTNLVLLVVLLVGLAIYWVAELAKIPTAKEREGFADFAVPALRDVEPNDITRIEIVSTEKLAAPLIALERSGDRQWSLVQPKKARAKTQQADALIANLKKLRSLPESHQLNVDAKKCGLAPPLRTIRLVDRDGQALASIDIGETVRKLEQFVRVDGVIRAVDANFLKMAFDAVGEWRERNLFSLPTPAVEAFSVQGPDRQLAAKRVDGKWSIVEPIRAPGDENLIENLLAEFVSMRVDGAGDEGFVADGANDLTAYGLEKPTMVITLTPTEGPPQAIAIGKESTDKPHHFFARRVDQNNIVLVNCAKMRDVGLSGSVHAIRSPRLFNLQPRQTDFIEILDNHNQAHHLLVRDPDKGWQAIEPVKGQADPVAITEFLQALNELQTLGFKPEAAVNRPELDKPWMVVKVWENSGSRGDVPESVPSVHLKLGRHDPLLKAVFAQINEESIVLTLLDTILNPLPQGELAFLDRTVLNLANEGIGKFVFETSEKRITIEGPPSFEGWTMSEPVVGTADADSVRRLASQLSPLRAQKMIARAHGAPELKRYGLDSPSVTVRWTLKSGQTGMLEIGDPVSKGQPERFAKLGGDERIFVLGGATLATINSEYRDRTIFSFSESDVNEIELIWPYGRVSFDKPAQSAAWTRDPEKPGELSELPPGLDLSKLEELTKRLAHLRTERYYQYEGPFRQEFGLGNPALTIRVQLSPGQRTFQLRIGSIAPEGRIATNESGDSGVAFAISGADWETWIRMAPELALPKDVFAPAPPAPK